MHVKHGNLPLDSTSNGSSAIPRQTDTLHVSLVPSQRVNLGSRGQTPQVQFLILAGC